MTIEEALALQQRYYPPRKPISFSWGDVAFCRRLFRELFCAADATAVPFRMLPEYEEVVEWMADTEGKGLLLWGDCGRGKTVILTGVVPVLLSERCGGRVPVYRAEELERKQHEVRSSGQELETVLEVLKFTRYPIIDDVGTEPKINRYYGEKYEGFSSVVSAAEAAMKPLFVSTNLTPVELNARYGTRTLDRLGRLCKAVHFKGESLR